MKVVLVFCEGRHDVVFAQRSLGARGGCEWVDKPIGDLPVSVRPQHSGKEGAYRWAIRAACSRRPFAPECGTPATAVL